MLYFIFVSAFKPRDTSAQAIKKRKTLQKSKRYHSVAIKYKKQEDRGEIDLEKTMVAVKKLKSNFLSSPNNIL